MNILITGGSGFLGRALTAHLQQQLHTVTWVSRNNNIAHPNAVQVIDYESLRDSQVTFDSIINLAGAGIADKRWSNARKQLLLDSRLQPTQAILDYLAQAPSKPSLFISGSATGWYGIQSQTVDENSAAHEEFTHQLCEQWEKLAQSASEFDVPTVIIRTGVVMSPTGGMVGKLRLPFSLGLGGKLGDGRQHIAWISLNDWLRAVDFILQQVILGKSVQSIYNLTAPQAITNEAFTRIMAQWLRRPAFFSQSKVLLQLLFGEMSVLLLGNQHVRPTALLETGFEFEQTCLSQVLESS